MSVSAFLRITRPHNAIVAGLTALLGYLIATGTLTVPSLLLAVIVALITAGGNVINDIFDIDIDRINRPDRPLPAGKISPGAAKTYALALFLSGIVLAALTRIAAAFLPSETSLMHSSATLWTLAFLGFCVRYGAMLVGPKLKPRKPNRAPAA